MKNVLFKVGILAFVLVFGMMILGCEEDDGGGGSGGGDGGEDWVNVTSFAQLNGTWKTEDSIMKYINEGFPEDYKVEETYTFNASAKTITQKQIYSGSYTHDGITEKNESESTSTMTINASTKTVTMSAKSITTMSGFSDAQWTYIQTIYPEGETHIETHEGIPQTYTLTIDNSKRTITRTSTVDPYTFIDEDDEDIIAVILSFGWQISRDGRKLKMHYDGEEIYDDEGNLIKVREEVDIIYMLQK